MTKLVYSFFLVIVLSTGCSPKEKTKANNEPLIKFTQFSESVKDTFYIQVQLPNGYYKHPDKKYPTVFLVDGNFYFPMMASILNQYKIAGLLEPVILVGVGYKSFQIMDSLRNRDYLYPKALPSDEVKSIGGGQHFYDFLTKELIPKVDHEFRTENNDRALLGHSFGGYFVLYGLLHQLETRGSYFKTFISASPTLWYNKFYLNKLPDQLKLNQTDLNLFISVGGLEDSIWSVKPLKELSAEIQKSNIKGLQFKSRVYSYLPHMDVALLSFTRGLQELHKDDKK